MHFKISSVSFGMLCFPIGFQHTMTQHHAKPQNYLVLVALSDVDFDVAADAVRY